MINKRLFITNGLIYFTFILAFIFTSNLAIFDFGAYNRPFSTVEYSLLFSVLTILIGLTLYLEFKKNNIRPNYLVLILFLGLFISNIIATFLVPSNVDITFVGTDGLTYITNVTSSLSDRIYNILNNGVTILLTYFLFFILPHKFHYRKQLNYLFYAVTIFTIVIIAYTFFAELETYRTIWDGLIRGLDVAYQKVKSIFINGNNYGFVILLGIIALIYLNNNRPNVIWYLLMIVFYLAMIFSLCKTTIAIATIVLPFYMIARSIVTMKKHQIRNIFLLVTLLSIITAFVIIVGLSTKYDNLPILKQINFFLNDIFKDHGTSTMDSRGYLWSLGYQIIKQFNLFIGVGKNQFGELLSNMQDGNGQSLNNLIYVHNGYLNILGEGGLLLAFFSLGMFIYVLYVAIKTFKYDKNIVFYSALGYAILFVYMWAETPAFIFASSLEHFLFIAMINLPLFSRYYYFNHPYYNHEILYYGLNDELYQVKEDNNFSLIKPFSFILLPLLGVALSFLFYLAITNNISWIPFYSVLGITLFLLLVLPIFLEGIRYRVKKLKINKKKFFLECYLVPFIYLISVLFITNLVFYLLPNPTFTILCYVTILLVVIFYALSALIKPLNHLLGVNAFFNHLNNLFIKIYCRGIKKDLSQKIEINPYTPDEKRHLLLIAPKKTYHLDEIITGITKMNFVVEVYSNDLILNKFEKLLVKINPNLISYQSELYLEDIAIKVLNKKYTHIVIIDEPYLNKRLLKNLFLTHLSAHKIYLRWHKMNRSRAFIKLFDKAYLVAKEKAKQKKYYHQIEQFASTKFLINHQENNQFVYGNLLTKNNLNLLNKLNAYLVNPLSGYFVKEGYDLHQFATPDFLIKYHGHAHYEKSFADVYQTFVNAKYVLLLEKNNYFIIHNYLIETLYSYRKIIVPYLEQLTSDELYQENNLYLYDQILNYDHPFFRDNYRLFPQEIYRRYHINQFLKEVLK